MSGHWLSGLWYGEPNDGTGGPGFTPNLRPCFECGAPITQCFGGVSAADFLAMMEGAIPFRRFGGSVRERCGICALASEMRGHLDARAPERWSRA
jgi:hypothetical protein